MASGGSQPRPDEPGADRPGRRRDVQPDRDEPGLRAGRGAGRHGHGVGQRARPGHLARQRARCRSRAWPQARGLCRGARCARSSREHIDGPRQLGLPRRAARQRARAQPGARRGSALEVTAQAMARRRRPAEVDSRARCASAAGSRSSWATRRASARPTRMLAEAHRRVLARRGRRRRLRRAARPAGDGRARRGARARPAQAHRVPRQATFDELDTDAVIARHPEWVLVDELAHTNVPGTRHEKRWQSVEEILDAGINVHLDGQHPALREPQRHRLRDHRRARARDRARTRARRGRRGRARRPHPRRAPQPPASAAWSTTSRRSRSALANFFRRENLVALRELALRKTAEEVDDFLERIDAGRGRPAPWAAEERILVCVRPGPLAVKLVRRGHRLARAAPGPALGAPRAHAAPRAGRGDGSWTTSSRSPAPSAGRSSSSRATRWGRRSCASPASGTPASSSSASHGGPGSTRSCADRRSRASSGRSIAPTSWSSPTPSRLTAPREAVCTGRGARPRTRSGGAASAPQVRHRDGSPSRRGRGCTASS